MKTLFQRLLLLGALLMPWVTEAQDSCVINSLPYFNDFENVSGGSYINAFPSCWVRINNSTSNNYYPYVATGDASIIHGNRSLFWKTAPTIYYPDNEYAVLPAVEQSLYDSLISNLTLSFYAKSLDTLAPWPIFIVGVMYNSNDTSSFVPVDTITLTPNVTLYTVDFANYADSGKYIAIRCPRSSEERRSTLDDIYLNRTDQFCYPPSNLTAVSSDTEVTLSWHGNGNSSFTVMLGANTVTGVTDTFYTFHNLADSTLYEYAVAAECASGNSLFLSGSIQTECRALTYDDLPYREDFESYGYGYHVEAISPCWHRGTIGSTISHNPVPSRCIINNDTVGLSFGAGSWYSGWAALPKLDDSIDVSSLEVEFVVVRPSTQYRIALVTVGVATDFYTDSTNNVQFGGFVPVETFDLSNEPLGSINPASVRFEDYAGDGRYIVFVAPTVPDSSNVPNIYSNIYNNFLLDNVTLKVANPCPTPQHVSVTHTTAYSTTATWNSIEGVDTFMVFVGAAGSDISTFTPYNAYGNSIIINSLNADTEYELIIVANCNNGLSDASYPVRFHTLCAPIDVLPFYEDFEGVTGITYPQSNVNNLPHCWLYWNMGSEFSYMGFPVVYTDASNTHSGTNTMLFRRYDSDQIAIMPLTEETHYPVSNLQVSFWIRSAFNSNYELVVGVMSDPADTSTFIPVRTILPGYGMHHTVGFANYDGPHGHVAFKAPMPTYGGNQFFIDDITLEEIPVNCATVTAIHAEPTASAARITWDYNIEFGTPTSFVVNYRNVEDSTLTTVATTRPELLLTGLAPDSSYWVSVGAECNGLNGEADTIVFRTQELPCISWDTIARAVDTIVLGNPGTETSAMYPVYANAPFSIVQHLFLASEIPVTGPATLTGIGFDYADNQPYQLGNCAIYLSHSPNIDLSGVTNPNLLTTGQLVFSGTLSFISEGWNYIPFNQGTFDYDGTSNLIVTITKSTGVAVPSPRPFRQESTPDRIMTRWATRPNHYVSYGMGTFDLDMRSNTRLITGGQDVYCTGRATCIPPITLVDTSATGIVRLLWIPGYQEESWDVDYRLVNPTDTGEWVNAATETTATEHLFNITDLEQGSIYEFRVTGNCSDTILSSSVTVTTPCIPLSIPFHYGFEGLSTGGNRVPADIHCWHHLNDATTYNGHPTITSGAHTGNRGLGFGVSASMYYCNYQAIVLPPVDTNMDAINALYLNFWARSSTRNDDPILLVGVMTNPNDINTFQTVDSVFIDPAIRVWDRYEVSFENYNGNGQYIAIRANRPSLADWTATIDDITISYEPMCRRVDNIRLRDVTTDSATVYWTRGGDETEWELSIGDSIYYITDTLFNIHGLEGDTVYTVSIRAICSNGDTSSFWSSSFHTPCYLLSTLPLINDFENTPHYELHTTSYIEAFPNCWRRVNNLPSNNSYNGRPYIRNSVTNGIHGNNSMYWELTTEYKNLYVVLPPVDKSVYNTSDLYLMFYARTLNNSEIRGSYVIGVMDHDGDTANFVAVDTITPTIDVTLYTVSLANYSGTGNYITIRGSIPSYGRELLLDDIVLTDQICNPVSHLRASSTDTSVTLVWSPEGNSGFTAVLGDDTVRGITDAFYTFHPLANDTLYTYAVAAECERNSIGTSDSVAENNFILSSVFQTGSIQTECPPLTMDDIPYRENFESYEYGYQEDIDPCWRRGSVPSTVSGRPHATHLYIGEDTVGFSMGATPHYYRWAALPRLDASIDITSLEVNFLVQRPGASGTPLPSTLLIVGVAEDVTWFSGNLPAASMELTAPSLSYTYSRYVPVDTIDLNDEPFSSLHSVTVSFANYTGSGRYIVFYAPSPESETMANNSFAIDNVELRLAAPCPTPENVQVTGTTSYDVFATWDCGLYPCGTNGNANPDQWLVYVGAPGFDFGSTSPYIFSDNTAAIGGLTPNTDYEMVIIASCGGNEGYPSYPVQFHTQCAPLNSLPFVEDFESVAGLPSYTTYSNTNTLPDCWLRHNTSVGGEYSGAPLVHNDSTYAHSGHNAMRFHTANYPVMCSDQYAIMPLTDSVLYPTRGLQVSFWLRTAHFYYNSFIVVGVMSDPNDTNSFVAMDTVRIESLGDYSHHTVRMAGYRGSHGHIAFKAPFQSSVNRPYIDDITLDVHPCSPVDNLHVVYTTTDSIIIAWNDAGDAQGAWYLEFDTVDFTPGTGMRTPVSVLYSSFTFSGLSPATTYHVYLYPDCLDTVEYHHLEATTLDPPIACPPPQEVSGTVSADSLSLNWTPGGNESAWEVTYSSITVVVDTPAYTFRNLPLSNGYTIHIRALCGEGDTSSTVTVSFPNHRFMITATVDDPAHGSATGGGLYYYGDVATLTAIPNTGYSFTEWDDGNTANPRNLFVTGDTTIVAMFQPTEDTGGIINIQIAGFHPQLSICPNPANDAITVSVTGISGTVRIAVLDLSGRELRGEIMECRTGCEKSIDIKGLASGTYFVRVTSDGYNAIVKKLVVM